MSRLKMKLMKNTIMLGLMSISLLSTVSCGKEISKVVKQVGKKLSKELECGVSQAGAQIESDFAQDYDVKLYKSTVEKVLADLRVVKYLDPKDFWAFLSDDTRNLLNYELNVILLKNKSENPANIYQAAAYFFTSVRDLFQEGTDYKLKDENNKLFSFSVRAIKSTRSVMVNSKCGKFQTTDLASITVDEVSLKIADVKDVIECRTQDNKSFVVMNGADMLYLESKKEISRLRIQGFKKEINPKHVTFSYDSRDVSFDVKINKKRDEMIQDWHGKKARLEFKSAALTIDDMGACNSLKNTLEY